MRGRRVTLYIALVSLGTFVAISACVSDATDTQYLSNEGGGAAEGSIANDDGGVSTTNDAAKDAGSSASDASADATPLPPCDRTKAFAPKGKIGGLDDMNASDEYSATLSHDELTIFFASDVGTGATNLQRIYLATRAKTTDPFSNVTAVLGVNATIANGTFEFPSLSDDGKTLYFAAADKNGDPRTYRIYVSRSSGGLFPTGAIVSDVDQGGSGVDTSPYFLHTNLALYMHSSGGRDGVFRAASNDGGFGAPVVDSRFHEVDSGGSNGGGLESYPVVNDDESTVFYAARYAFAANPNTFDIWSRDDAGALLNVASLNTPSDQYPAWLSGDGCRLYYVQNTELHPDLDIYWAERPQ